MPTDPSVQVSARRDPRPVLSVPGLEPDIAADLDELADSLRLAQVWLSRLPLLAEEEFELSQTRMQVLGAIDGGARRVQDVAEAIWSSMSAASRNVDALVQDGLVDRQADPDDRRASLLQVTDAGVRRLREIDAWRRELITEVYRGLGPERVREVARAFADVGEQLQPVVERWHARTMSG